MKNADATRLLLTGRLAPQILPLLGGVAIECRLALTEDDIEPEWPTACAGFSAPNIALPYVTWFHSMGAGVDGFVAAANECSALLTRTVGSLPELAADYVVGVILSDALRLDEYVGAQAKACWKPLDRMASEPVAVVGTGTLGQAVARRLSAFGHEVIGISRSGSPVASFSQVVPFVHSAQTLRRSNTVVVTLPLTSSTKNLVDGHFLAQLRGALLVNIGRGGVLQPGALRVAIDSGSVRKAVLDVHSKEPLPPDSWEWFEPRVLITPHVAAVSTPQDVAAAITECALALRAGLRLPNMVDIKRGY